jgi:hypothetical protein
MDVPRIKNTDKRRKVMMKMKIAILKGDDFLQKSSKLPERTRTGL